MSDDFPNSDVADPLHDDLLVKRVADSENTGFSIDVGKGALLDAAPKTPSKWVFLQTR
jgi:hypothetical protein